MSIVNQSREIEDGVGRSSWLLSVALVVALTPFGVYPSLAQEAEVGEGEEVAAQQTADEDTVWTDQIVVSAQKREETAQEVPISIVALPETFLENAGIESIQNLAPSVAGLEIVNTGPGQNRIMLRGIGDFAGSFQSSATTGYYIDEVPITTPPSQMAEVALFDVERVEVLRGPQGTLFGDGSMGGTIRVITQKPDSQSFSGRALATLSSIDEGGTGADIRGVLNAPLSRDQLAARLIVGYRDIDGYVDNPGLGLEDTNEEKRTDTRFALGWTPGDRWSLDLAHVYQKLEYADDLLLVEPYIKNTFVLEPQDSEIQSTSLTMVGELGWASFVSGSGYTSRENLTVGDVTQAAQFLIGPFIEEATFNGEMKQDTFTQEFRFVSTGSDSVLWTAGVFYKHDERTLLESAPSVPDLVPIIGAPILDSLLEMEIDQIAVFGEAKWLIKDNLTLLAGGRYFSDERENLLNSFGLLGPPEEDLFTEGDDSKFTPKLSLTWAANDDVLVFGSAAQGFRSGGLNVGQPTIEAVFPGLSSETFDAETLTSVELGVKTMKMSRSLMTNFYAYYQDWDDLQLNFATPDGLFLFVENAGSARSMGGEVEVVATPASGLQLTLGLAYVDSEIREDVYDQLGNQLSASGNRIPYVPKFSASLGFEYTRPVGDRMFGLLRGDYSYRASNYSDPDNTPEFKNASSNLVGLRVGLEGMNWGVFLWGANLLEEDASTIRTSNFLGSPITVYTPPRSLGVDFKVSF